MNTWIYDRARRFLDIAKQYGDFYPSFKNVRHIDINVNDRLKYRELDFEIKIRHSLNLEEITKMRFAEKQKTNFVKKIQKIAKKYRLKAHWYCRGVTLCRRFGFGLFFLTPIAKIDWTHFTKAEISIPDFYKKGGMLLADIAKAFDSDDYSNDDYSNDDYAKFQQLWQLAHKCKPWLDDFDMIGKVELYGKKYIFFENRWDGKRWLSNRINLKVFAEQYGLKLEVDHESKDFKTSSGDTVVRLFELEKLYIQEDFEHGAEFLKVITEIITRPRYAGA